jgi:PhzF family phenazine biosynthesis protein
MREVRFKQVDVFTRTPFRGNPVAVVLEGKGFSSEEMQHIAKWTNLSETTFVLPPTSASADYLLRIFSPRMELPFAGHPTIGSAHAVLEGGVAKAKGGKLRQECGAGVLDLQVDGDTLWLDSPAAKERAFAEQPLLEKILGAKIVGTPQVFDVGPKWVVAEVADAKLLAGLAPDMQAMTELTDRLEITGITAYGASNDGKSAIHVRSFAPAHGIPEDPVCGSGNISVATYLRKAGRLAEGYVARQGMQMGRDGRVAIRFEGGKILIGGSAVTCIEGMLRI